MAHKNNLGNDINWSKKTITCLKSVYAFLKQIELYQNTIVIDCQTNNIIFINVI